MDVYQCIRTRLTVREFKPDPVPERVVRLMLQAARWAPSARNRQPWNFIVIRNPDTLARIGGIASSGAFIGDAPLAVAVVMGAGGRPEFDAGTLPAADGANRVVRRRRGLCRRRARR